MKPLALDILLLAASLTDLLMSPPAVAAAELIFRCNIWGEWAHCRGLRNLSTFKIRRWIWWRNFIRWSNYYLSCLIFDFSYVNQGISSDISFKTNFTARKNQAKETLCCKRRMTRLCARMNRSLLSSHMVRRRNLHYLNPGSTQMLIRDMHGDHVVIQRLLSCVRMRYLLQEAIKDICILRISVSIQPSIACCSHRAFWRNIEKF